MIRGCFDSHARRSGSKKRAVVSARAGRAEVAHRARRHPRAQLAVAHRRAVGAVAVVEARRARGIVLLRLRGGRLRSDGTSAGSGVDGGDPASASPGGGNDSAPFFLRSLRGEGAGKVGGRRAQFFRQARERTYDVDARLAQRVLLRHSRRIFWSARHEDVHGAPPSSASPPLVTMMRRAARNSAREAIGRKYGSSARVHPCRIAGNERAPSERQARRSAELCGDGVSARGIIDRNLAAADTGNPPMTSLTTRARALTRRGHVVAPGASAGRASR